jgi:hypothetical protein
MGIVKYITITKDITTIQDMEQAGVKQYGEIGIPNGATIQKDEIVFLGDFEFCVKKSFWEYDKDRKCHIQHIVLD